MDNERKSAQIEQRHRYDDHSSQLPPRGVGVEPKRMAELPMAIGQLENTTSGVETALDKLEARLASVRTPPPEATSGTEKRTPFGSQAASAIGVQTSRLDTIVRRIFMLEASLEV